MAIMNTRLWQKAYMLEFVDREGSSEFFSFAVPPESEDFEFGQRVTEIKTIGGSVFDDYGNDTVQIQISGTTVNEERKLVLRGKNIFLPKYLSGEKEIFELQKLIRDWGKGDKIPGKKIYLYDLSKMSALQMAAAAPSRNYWRVVIKKFKIKRSKDRPFTYQYTLDMTGMEDAEKSIKSIFSEKMQNVLNKCVKIFEDLENCYGYFEAGADALNKGVSASISAIKSIGKAFEEKETLKSGYDDLAKLYKGADMIFDAPVRIVTGSSGSGVSNMTRSLIAMGYNIKAAVRGKEGGQSTGSISSADKYTVSFDAGGGSCVTPEKVSFGKNAAEPDAPEKELHSFDGWYTDNGAFANPYDFGNPVTENITLYAKWTKTAAIVAFNSRQGSDVAGQTAAIGGYASKPDDPEREGYAFECWCADYAAQNEYDFSTPVAGDITLYARWRAVYTVDFDSGGGSAVPSQKIYYGGKIIYPITPLRENYLFGAWCADPQLTGEYNFNLSVTGSITLHAKWTQVSNNVAFDSCGGSAVPVQKNVAIGGYASKPDDPEREGYAFVRWCLDPGLAQEFLFTSTPVNYPITLYAEWETVTLRAEFDIGEESPFAVQNIEYGRLAVYPGTPVKQGCLFARWLVIEEIEIEETENEEGGEEEEAGTEEVVKEYDFSAPVVKNLTLYAEWHEGSGA